MDRTQPVPQVQARLGGFFYLIIIGVAWVAEVFVRGDLIDSANAAVTAHNIVQSELLYRAAIGIDLFVWSCDVVVALLLYVVLQPAGAGVALLAAFFRLVFVAVMSANELTAFVPLLLLKGGVHLSAFSGEQLQGLALVSLKLRDAGFNIALVFFGVHCFLVGVLIAKSGLLPRIVGVLTMIAGACYVVNSFNNFLPHELAAPLFPYILLLGLAGEATLALWLFFFGLNARRWETLTSQKA